MRTLKIEVIKFAAEHYMQNIVTVLEHINYDNSQDNVSLRYSHLLEKDLGKILEARRKMNF